MKKIFTLLCMMLFAVQFATAQQTLFVVSKSGELAAYPAYEVSFNDEPFVFTYGEVTNLTNNMFTASFKVALKFSDYEGLEQDPEVGICFSDINERPTIVDCKMKTGKFFTKYNFSINALDAGTTYYYRAYVKVNDVVYYGGVQKETTFGTKPENKCKIIDGHKFVDLGLPSGLLWATCNVGAATEADDGDYFAWGETEPKSGYNLETYKWMSNGDRTKYCSADGKTVLDKEDDAAYANWGASCRMPTNLDFAELCSSNNCIWTWTSRVTTNGSSINGFVVTSLKNGNSIFLPASGFCNHWKRDWYGVDGCYWSNTHDRPELISVYSLHFGKSGHDVNHFEFYKGFTVRPVAEP